MSVCVNRRRFLKKSATLAAGSAACSPFPMPAVLADPSPNAKIAFAVIGCGGRSAAHLPVAASERLVAVADPDESRIVDALPAPNLPADYPTTLGTDSTRGLKPVFEIGANAPRPKFVVLEVTRWQAEGELTFDDVKDRIRDQLGQQLAVQHYLDGLRRTTYIDFRF